MTGHRNRVAAAVLRLGTVLAVAALLAVACSDDETSAPTTDGTGDGSSTTTPELTLPIVLNGQGNHLDAYWSEPPFEHQRVISSAAEDPEDGLDINAQLCVFSEGDTRYLIAGEDTDQNDGGTQGWGLFELSGAAIGSSGNPAPTA